jgi:hypothetical protein
MQGSFAFMAAMPSDASEWHPEWPRDLERLVSASETHFSVMEKSVGEAPAAGS